MQTGKVTAVNESTGQIQITIDQNGRVLSDVNPFGIGNLTGIQFLPTEGDLVLVDDVDSFVAFITNAIPNDSTVLHNQPSAKPAAPYSQSPTLHKGELVILSKFGQTIKMDNLGNIILAPGGTGIIQLAAGSRKVVLDGDAVVGTDSHGDTITAHVVASSLKVTGQ